MLALLLAEYLVVVGCAVLFSSYVIFFNEIFKKIATSDIYPYTLADIMHDFSVNWPWWLPQVVFASYMFYLAYKYFMKFKRNEHVPMKRIVIVLFSTTGIGVLLFFLFFIVIGLALGSIQ